MSPNNLQTPVEPKSAAETKEDRKRKAFQELRKGLAKFKAFENRRARFYNGPKADAELKYFRGVLDGIAGFKPKKMSYK